MGGTAVNQLRMESISESITSTESFSLKTEERWIAKASAFLPPECAQEFPVLLRRKDCDFL